MKAVLYSFLAMVLVACTATGPKFQALQSPSSETAVIYVYRPHYFANGNVYPFVYIDGVKKSPLRAGGYVVHSMEPGTRKVEIKGDYFTWSARPIVIETTFGANTRYFLRFNSTLLSVGGGGAVKHELHMVSEENALAELPGMNLSE